MNLGDWLGILTVAIAVPLNWYVAWRLSRAATDSPTIRVLRERALAQFVLAIIVTVFGMIFLNNDQEIPPLDIGTTRIITRFTVLLSVVVALYWLSLYRPKAKR